jgi:hypothetical protein
MQRAAEAPTGKGGSAAVRRLAVLGLASVLLAVSLGIRTYMAYGAAQIQVLRFSERDLRFSKIGGYDLVSIAGARWLNEPGNPRLPLVPVRIALPPGSRVAGLSIVACDSVILPGAYTIQPSQPPQPLSQARPIEFVSPSPSVYSSSEPYPRRAAELVGSGSLSGTVICDVLVYPLRYLPADRTLILYTKLEIEADYEPTGASENAGTAAHGSLDLVARLAANRRDRPSAPEVGSSGPEPMADGGVAYLIVTGSALEPSFEPLRNWKMRKGLASEIVTTQTIAAAYAGADLQEKIRNCITYYHVHHGTQWVLLGGGVGIVPDRKVYVALSDRPYIPCDLYYADLDGTWNADGDLYWGEVPSDNVDMYADVFIGRAPVATAAEADTFVRKVLAYEGLSTLPDDYQLGALFLGQILWGDPGDPSAPDYTDAGIAKDLVAARYVPGRFSIERLYQSAGTLTRDRAVSALDSGKGLINICCHGLYRSISLADGVVDVEDFLALNSGGRYGLMYSTSCLGGGFDQGTCMGQAWALSGRGGGFYIGNSRYGWGSPGSPGDGPSDYYDQSFFESVFVTGFTNLGKAHADAKHEYVGESRVDPYMRYVMYGLNLLGDPETPLWTDVPREIAVECAGSISVDAVLYGVTATSRGEPLAGARVCLWKPGEVFAVGVTDVGGRVSLPLAGLTPGQLHVTVTASNVLPYVGETVVTVGPPHPAPPADLVALEGCGPSVNLAWTPVADPDLSQYKIYRNSSPEPEVHGSVAASETTFADTSVSVGETYFYWVSSLDSLGSEGQLAGPVSIYVEGSVAVPDDGSGVRVVSVTPNPFVADVRLVLRDSRSSSAQIGIFDVDGRCICAPRVTGEEGGVWHAVWDGTDSRGRRVAPGIYLIRFEGGAASETRKAILLK